MNYDKAYELQRSMRESAEYKALKQAEDLVKTDETSKKLVKDFIALQMQAEYAHMAGDKQYDEQVKKLQDMSALVSANSKARDFIQAYTVWVKASEDIYRILSEVITEGMSILEEKN